MKEQKDPKVIWRPAPCPSWDVEGTQRWLEEEAARGHILQKDGYLAGFFAFEVSTPRQLVYRLEAAERRRGIFDRLNGDPEPEAMEMADQMGWAYVAARGQFYIYASEHAERELNTDPRVQALSLAALRRRGSWNLAMNVLMILFYLWLAVRGRLLLMSLSLGTPLVLWLLVLSGVMLAGNLRGILHCRAMEKRLRLGEPLAGSAPGRGSRLRYLLFRGVLLAAWLGAAGLFLHQWGASILREDLEPLTPSLQAELPFPQLEDLRPGQTYTPSQGGTLFPHWNTLRRGATLLVPQWYEAVQHGTFAVRGAAALEADLDVFYGRAAAPWLAAELVREFFSWDQRNGRGDLTVERFAFPGLDEVLYSRGLPNTLLLRSGSRMLRIAWYDSEAGPDAAQGFDAEALLELFGSWLADTE